MDGRHRKGQAEDDNHGSTCTGRDTGQNKQTLLYLLQSPLIFLCLFLFPPSSGLFFAAAGSLRLDQTLGKPGMWLMDADRKRQQRSTVMCRLSRVEDKVADRKCEGIVLPLTDSYAISSSCFGSHRGQN